MDMGVERERTWRHIILGESWETSCPDNRAAFLESLRKESEYNGIWFKRATGNDDDDQLVADMLEAIRVNPWVSGLCFQDLEDKFPVFWLNEILFTRGRRIQEVRIMSGNTIQESHVSILSRGLASSSLKELYLDYPSMTLLKALTIALESETSQLEILGIADIPHDGYIQVAPVLCHCTYLKELILTGTSVNLDTNIDDLMVALVSNMPHLEIFSFEFGYATPRAFTKLSKALAQKDLKSLAFGCSEDYEEHVALADPTPVEQVLEANRRLEYFKVITTQVRVYCHALIVANRKSPLAVMLTIILLLLTFSDLRGRSQAGRQGGYAPTTVWLLPQGSR